MTIRNDSAPADVGGDLAPVSADDAQPSIVAEPMTPPQIDLAIKEFQDRDADLRHRARVLDLEKLEADIGMWQDFRRWGGVGNKHLAKRLEKRALKEGKTYPYQPYVQDFTGIYLAEINDPVRKSNLSSHVTGTACLWHALDAKYPEPLAKSVSEIADDVGSARAFTDAYKKAKAGVIATDVDSGSVAAERFDRFRNGGAFAAEFAEADKSLDGSISFNAMVDGKLRLFTARSLPDSLKEQLSRHVAAARFEDLDYTLGLLADVVAVTAFIPDTKDSGIPKNPADDPSARSTEFLPAYRQIVVQKKGSRIVVSQARKEAGVVVVAEPTGDVRLPDGFMDTVSRKMFANKVVPQGVRGQFGGPTIAAHADSTVLTFTDLQSADVVNLKLVPMSKFGSSGRNNLWSLDVELAGVPQQRRALGPDEVQDLRQLLEATASQASQALTAEFSGDGVSFALGQAKPLLLATTGDAPAGLKVAVLGSDFIAALKAALGEHDLAALHVGINPRGLLELRFETPWARYSVFCPGVTGKERVRKDTLLRRIVRA